ncbi:MAG: 50S ribosomal protein L10 [Desulfurococcales archaeon]|nr:50S ribosomal protein L10 [Desulfurococcales archaeon]
MSQVVIKRGRLEVPEWKKKAVGELATEIKKYKVIGVGSLERLPTAQFQQIRKKLRNKVLFKVVKTSIAVRALERAGIDLEKLQHYVTGSLMVVLTDMNPFELAKTLDELKVPVPAKPGQVAESDIIVPAGDTGIKPGPQLSTFSKLKIPYQIKGGSVWISKDTVVARKGSVISSDLAGFLQKMGILPFEVSVKLRAVYDGGIVIPGDRLKLDLEQTTSELLKAVRSGLEVGSEIVYPAKEVIELTLTKAYRRAVAIASEAGYLTPETAEQVFRSAIMKANAIIASFSEDIAKEVGVEPIAAAPVAAATAPAKEEKKEEEKKEEKEEEEEELSEEDLAAGLGALFG